MEGPSEAPGNSVLQPAAEPFVFRSGGPFGSGYKARTIQDAVRHMDRYHEDGIYHLRNGTLAQWLEDQQAHELAHLARQVVAEGYTDPRVMLETFLLGTGLVARPRMVLRPKVVRMGYILAGQSCAHELQIRQSRGRGYLFGKLHRDVPWLTLDPTTFSGRQVQATVSVDTRNLPIGTAVQEARIAVESSASEQPVAVPVRFRVMPMPSRFDRSVLRPLAGLLVAGILGAGIGWLLGSSGVGAPRRLPAPAFWAAAIGAPWAVLGAVRGIATPVAWPLSYTLGRWLLRTVTWAATLALVVALALWLVPLVIAEVGLRGISIPWAPALLGASALAVLPGILGELWITRVRKETAATGRPVPVLRPGLMIVSAVIIAVLLLAGARYAAPALQKYPAGAALGTAETWTQRQMGRLDSLINDLIDRFYLRLYDRRAPAQPTPASSPSPEPTR